MKPIVQFILRILFNIRLSCCDFTFEIFDNIDNEQELHENTTKYNYEISVKYATMFCESTLVL